MLNGAFLYGVFFNIYIYITIERVHLNTFIVQEKHYTSPPHISFANHRIKLILELYRIMIMSTIK